MISEMLRIMSNESIRVGRHAVSIDERRAFFPPLLWRQSQPGSNMYHHIQQVWFPGVHSDVGGGYDETESDISNLTLSWMIKEAKEHGLIVRQDLEQSVTARAKVEKSVNGVVLSHIHESLRGAWDLLWNGPPFRRSAAETFAHTR